MLGASMRITVIGARGQVASALAERSSAAMPVSRLGRPRFDLETISDMRAAIASTRPDVVINAAAFTNVEEAECHSDRAFKVNTESAAKVASIAHSLGVPLIHLSTEYVFDGESPLPYSETDTAMPLNVYGHSKLAGEYAVMAETDNHAILRTSWIYSVSSWNFFSKIRAQARQKTEVQVIADRLGAPTSAFELAWGIERIAHNLITSHGAHWRGIFHMTCGGETSWAGFAREIIARSPEASIAGTIVHPIPTGHFPELARRPTNSRLNNDRVRKVHGVVLAPWQDALAAVMIRLRDTHQPAEMLAIDQKAAAAA